MHRRCCGYWKGKRIDCQGELGNEDCRQMYFHLSSNRQTNGLNEPEVDKVEKAELLEPLFK
ncbi:hypothetical protein NXW09_28280 [Bacteroides ovatus]|nr:hypothetical protein [Bacteroides ovatus]